MNVRVLVFMACGLPVLAWADEEINRSRLPVALTISGGVSLGNYQAGLNWVLIETLSQLRHPSDKGPFLVYETPVQRMDVELTTITGASAGSINTLVSALTYCRPPHAPQADDNAIKNTWVNVGFNELLPGDNRHYLPAKIGPGDNIHDAVLSRKPFMEIVKTMHADIERGEYALDCPLRHLALALTRDQALTTNIAGIEVFNQRFMVALAISVESATPGSGTGRIKFRNKLLPASHIRYQILLPEDARGEVSIDDVINTVLASSAFPLAFGRVRLKYCLAVEGTKTRRDCPSDQAESGFFLDGGVFDNVPLGASFALAEGEPVCRNRRGDGCPTEQFQYVYLDPDTRRAPTLTPAPETPAKATTETSYGLLDQSAFLLDAVKVGRKSELFHTLTDVDWQINRRLLLTSRLPAVTGDYIGAFGAFVDRRFREYDYYAGVYDGVKNMAYYMCDKQSHLFLEYDGKPVRDCAEMAVLLANTLGLCRSAGARNFFRVYGEVEAYGNNPCGNDAVETELDRKFDAIFKAMAFANGAMLKTPEGFIGQQPFDQFINNLLGKNIFEADTEQHFQYAKHWYYDYVLNMTRRMLYLENQTGAVPTGAKPLVFEVGLINYITHTLFKNPDGSFPLTSAPAEMPWYFNVMPDELSSGSDRNIAVAYHFKRFGGRYYFEPNVSMNASFTNTVPDYYRAGFNVGLSGTNRVFSGVIVGFDHFGAVTDNVFRGYEAEIGMGLFADKIKLSYAQRDYTANAFDQAKDWYFAVTVADIKGLVYWLVKKGP